MKFSPFSAYISVYENDCLDNPINKHSHPCAEHSHVEIDTQQISQGNTAEKHG